MNHTGAVALVCLVVLAACSAGPAATPPPATLEIAGSTSMGPVLAELAADFQAQNPSVLVNVRGGGTGIGLSELQSGRVNVAGVSWVNPADAAPEGLTLTPLARDAIAIIVHPTNPITNLTSLQLRALYRGETLDWGAVGAPAGAPDIISREEGSGTRAAFESLAMSGERVTLNARVMTTSRTVVDYVASHRLAVGYVTLSAVDVRVRAVPLEGVAPTREATESGAYALTRLLYLATPQRSTPAAAAFVAFAAGPQAQRIIAQEHVPVR